MVQSVAAERKASFINRVVAQEREVLDDDNMGLRHALVNGGKNPSHTSRLHQARQETGALGAF